MGLLPGCGITESGRIDRRMRSEWLRRRCSDDSSSHGLLVSDERLGVDSSGSFMM